MKKILVVGSLNMDFVINVQKMPVPGETILAQEMRLVPGGKGANQAYAAAKLGGQVAMIGAVGDDPFGRQLTSNLAEVGVDISGIETLTGCATGNAMITVEEQGENAIIVVPGANAHLTTEMIDKHIRLVDACDIIIMQLEIPLDVVSYVKKLGIEHGKQIILDPAPARADLPDGFFEGFDIVKPNETELQTLLGKTLKTPQALREGAGCLLQKGIGTVLVTLGGDGAWMVTKDSVKAFHACKVTPVDTTAAGDSFTAAFAVACSRGQSYEEAIAFGNRVSSIVVTRPGAQTSIPTMEEVAGIQ